MKTLISIEEAALTGLGAWLAITSGIAWYWLLVFLLVPDISMLGYLAGPKIGAFTYNVVHHKALAVALFVAGAALGVPVLQFAGGVLLAHSSMDRVLGYGLKYPDAFSHTHLGTLRGRSA
jgi:Domain of unknown function (DUF4260)